MENGVCVDEGLEIPSQHELLAPTLLRSQTLSVLHPAVHRGELPPDVALDRLWRMKIKLLGDAVLRRRGLGSGGAMGWADTYTAEVALTQLQADAFATLDEGLARSLDGVVATAPIDVLR